MAINMKDTSLSSDSSEPGAELLVSKKKSKKKKRYGSALSEESPFPQPQPCVKGALVEGLVSTVEEDEGYFWLQREPDKVDKVGEMLKRSRGESFDNQDQPIGGGEELKVGSAVVAEWKGTLYRGVVTGKSATRLQVCFVDWGNSDKVDKTRVRLALETELEEPSLAIRCYLEEMPSCWEEDLAKSNFLAEMICKEVKEGLPIMSLKKGARILEPVPEEEEEEEFKTAGEDLESGMCDQNAFSSSADAKTKFGTEVIVSHVESRREIWVQKVAREQELDLILEELQTLKPNLEVVESPKLGDFVAATFSEDGDLYRARVVSSTPLRCTVIFVDFGNSEEKNKDELLMLPFHLQEEKLPAFAVQVTVAEGGSGWSKKQLESLKGDVVAMFINAGGEAVLNKVDTEQGDLEKSAEGENYLVGSESGAIGSTDNSDSLKDGMSINSRGEAVLGKDDANQGDQEEKSDENNNTPTTEIAMEMRDLKEMDLPPYDPDQAADVTGAINEECHSVTSLLPKNVKSSNDFGKLDQTIKSSTSPMKRTPNSTIIDASDGEECDLDAGAEVETVTSLPFVAEQEADVQEKFKPSLGSENETTLLPLRNLEDSSGSLEDLLQVPVEEVERLVEKLMAEECSREKKEEVLSILQSENLLQLAIHPTYSQVVQAAVFAVSQDQSLQPSLIRNLAAHLPTLATHPDGYLVVLAALDGATSEQKLLFTCWLEDEAVVLSLLGSKVGAFIVRRMMEWGLDPLIKTRLIWVLLPHLYHLATSGTATWVLQTLLEEEVSLGGERELASALISNNNLEKLVRDPSGCDLLAMVVSLREGALAPRAASWILQNTAISSSHAAQFASVVRQLLAEGRDPNSQFLLDRWTTLEEEDKSGEHHPLLKIGTAQRNSA